MIDEQKLAQVTGNFTPVGNSLPSIIGLTEDELRALRDEIDALLPSDSLASMNLEGELVRQYRKVLKLQEDVLNDDTIPANQRSQVAGQVASTLQHLIKMQTEFHTAERFKEIENLMIKHMRKLPKDVAEAFLDDYAKVGV